MSCVVMCFSNFSNRFFLRVALDGTKKNAFTLLLGYATYVLLNYLNNPINLAIDFFRSMS